MAHRWVGNLPCGPETKEELILIRCAPVRQHRFADCARSGRVTVPLSKSEVISVGCQLQDPDLLERCREVLHNGRHQLRELAPHLPLPEALAREDGPVDVLLLDVQADAGELALLKGSRLLPTVFIGEPGPRDRLHRAEVHAPVHQLRQLGYYCDAAVSRFLQRMPPRPVAPGATGDATAAPLSPGDDDSRWQLDTRLQERLGYLGVFYKRDSSRFLRHLPDGEREDLLRSLERSYHDLMSSYFRDSGTANRALENFVNTAFFADLPLRHVVDIHMQLIRRFTNQLKLEGHRTTFLKDYRLTLIDVMAHLAELYRRSVPPEHPAVRQDSSISDSVRQEAS